MVSIRPLAITIKNLECFRQVPILVSTEEIECGGTCLPVSWKNCNYRYWIKIGKDAVDRGGILIHEYAHVRQFESGRLATIRWKGYVFEDVFYPSDHPYHDRPWEIEAFAIQRRWNETMTTNEKVLSELFTSG